MAHDRPFRRYNDFGQAAPGRFGTAPDRGRLKLFFGYTSGVGLTRAMVQAVRVEVDGGARVHVAGLAAAEDAFDQAVWPPNLTPASAEAAQTFDLDVELRSRPDLLLLPGLARRNPASARHRRRYQDVEELLEAGVDVWSTLEVGQLESLADLVERITGAPVVETVPDAVFDAADEVELIDLPPGEVARRPSGSAPGQATLVALREIALRRAADRLQAEGRRRPDGRAQAGIGATAERLLVGVGPSPTSARVVRAGGRMARSLHAPWLAVHVAPEADLAPAGRQTVAQHLRLAAALGAEVLILRGGHVADELVDQARARRVTKILIGKPMRRRQWAWLRRSLADQVISASGEIDVYVVRGGRGGPAGNGMPEAPPLRLRVAGGVSLALALATAVAAAFTSLGLSEANLVLAYLLAVTAVAALLGRAPAICASFGAVLLFNFFFTSPRFTLRVHDSGYLFTFAVMLVIGLLVSTLTARVREQSLAARERERRTEQLCQLSQELSATTGQRQIVATGEHRLSVLLDLKVAILLPDVAGRLSPAEPSQPHLALDARSLSVAQWVYEHARAAGAGTDTHDGAPVLCLPLTTPEGVAGVVAVEVSAPESPLLPDRRRLVETFAAQVALALQRDRLSEEVHRTLAQAENERLRSTVLSSISHDLRTPLAAITGASSNLLDAGERLQPGVRRELLQAIHEEADRLARLVDNLLHMTRLEAGRVEARREWHLVEDLVGSALTRMAQALAGREVTTRLPAQLPLVRVDGELIELILINLLDNAVKYSPPGSGIRIAAHTTAGRVVVEVADRGPGVRDVEKVRVFEKLYRGTDRRGDKARGSGLGLAICAAITRIHDGLLRVTDHEGGGACFLLELPLEEQPPELPLVDAASEGVAAT